MTATAKLRIGVLLFAAIVAFPSAVGSAEPNSNPPTTASSDWSFVFRPYGWVTWLDGDVTVRGRTAELDVSPKEVIEDLKMAWFSYAEARVGRIAVFNDIAYANLGLSRDAAHIRDNAGTDVSLGVDLKQATVELGGAYTVGIWQTGGSFKDFDTSAPTTALEVLGGVRYWYQEVDLGLSVTADLDLGGLNVRGKRAVARSGSVDWVDPFIGLRVRHSWHQGGQLFLRGDIGGFSAGSAFSWQLIGALNFEIASRDGVTCSGVVGYRALSADYEQGSGRREYRYDVLQHGPLVGLELRF